MGGEGPLEKGMAILSSILAWRIPWTEEPGGLQSMESQRVQSTGLSDLTLSIQRESCDFLQKPFAAADQFLITENL